MEASLYRTIWRWHLVAGLIILPIVLLLAASGSVYLFKPQIERFEEQAYRHLPAMQVVAPEQQLAAVLDASPGARFGSYRLPRQEGDAAMITLQTAEGPQQWFVAPDGGVLGHLDPAKRIAEVAKRFHSQLLLGPRGSWITELAASWAFVLLLSGLYLWWPRKRGLAGILWPRLGARGRVFWRDLHAVTAVWLYALLLVVLLTALPWTGVWGSAFQSLRADLGWVKGTPEWTLGGEPPADPHAAHTGPMAPMMAMDHAPGLDRMVASAKSADLAFPVYVVPPAGLGRFGVGHHDAGWMIYSDSQNRPQQVTLDYDADGRHLLNVRRFADDHPIDRVIGFGIAWHEGQLLGWFNQLVGVLTAFGLMGVVLSGFVMWRRRPELPAAPPLRLRGNRSAQLALGVLLLLAALLPLLALSLLLLGLLAGVRRLWRPRPRGMT